LQEFNNILEKIIACSIKVNNIIKNFEKNAEKETDIDIIEDINNTYKERSMLIEELKSVFDEYENKEEVLKDNQLWIKYNDEILTLETQNIGFFNKKFIETKKKLTELSNNKSLLLYNQKVKLSYEDKLI
jgi:hypothetical protein